jgi:hypothetical protein
MAFLEKKGTQEHRKQALHGTTKHVDQNKHLNSKLHF